MELIIRLYKENTEILCEQFDGRAFFNAIPIYLANKLGIENILMNVLKQVLKHLKKD